MLYLLTVGFVTLIAIPWVCAIDKNSKEATEHAGDDLYWGWPV